MSAHFCFLQTPSFMLRKFTLILLAEDLAALVDNRNVFIGHKGRFARFVLFW